MYLLSHERRLRVLDIADVALNQRVQKLNETEIHKLSELFLSVEKLEKNISSLNGILQSRNEVFSFEYWNIQYMIKYNFIFTNT